MLVPLAMLVSLAMLLRSQWLVLILAYVIAFCTTLGTAYLSDKYRRRAPFLMFWSAIATLGYVLLMVLPRSVPGVHYFALFIATAGAAPMIATTISWTGNTWGNVSLLSFQTKSCQSLIIRGTTTRKQLQWEWYFPLEILVEL
jgi:hypothetical protein